MSSVGARLKRERESRHTTLDELSRRTQVGRDYLDALERDEIDGLPGRAFGKFYIRVYAEVLGFDPQPLIDDYDRERWRRERQERAEPPSDALADRPDPPLAADAARDPAPAPADAAAEPATPYAADPAGSLDSALAPENPVEHIDIAAPGVPTEARVTEPAAGPPNPDPRTVSGVGTPDASERASRVGGRLSFALAAVVVLAGMFWIAYLALPEDPSEPAADPSASTPTAAGESPGVGDAWPQTPRDAGVASSPQDQEPAPATRAEPTRLTVAEHGVGRNVVDRRLEGQADVFEEGSEVWFWTRVLGGTRGTAIRHVWLREGRPVQTIALRVGGPHWRTHSSKTVWGVGRWSVEARDEQDRVLAQTTFDCIARSDP